MRSRGRESTCHRVSSGLERGGLPILRIRGGLCTNRRRPACVAPQRGKRGTLGITYTEEPIKRRDRLSWPVAACRERRLWGSPIQFICFAAASRASLSVAQFGANFKASSYLASASSLGNKWRETDLLQRICEAALPSCIQPNVAYSLLLASDNGHYRIAIAVRVLHSTQINASPGGVQQIGHERRTKASTGLEIGERLLVPAQHLEAPATRPIVDGRGMRV